MDGVECLYEKSAQGRKAGGDYDHIYFEAVEE